MAFTLLHQKSSKAIKCAYTIMHDIPLSILLSFLLSLHYNDVSYQIIIIHSILKSHYHQCTTSYYHDDYLLDDYLYMLPV